MSLEFNFVSSHRFMWTQLGSVGFSRSVCRWRDLNRLCLNMSLEYSLLFSIKQRVQLDRQIWIEFIWKGKFSLLIPNHSNLIVALDNFAYLNILSSIRACQLNQSKWKSNLSALTLWKIDFQNLKTRSTNESFLINQRLK